MKYQPKHAANDSNSSRKASGKKLIAKLLVVCMIIGLLPAAAFAADIQWEDSTGGGKTYTLTEDTTWEKDYKIGEDASGTAPEYTIKAQDGVSNFVMNTVTIAQNNILTIDGKDHPFALQAINIQLGGAMVITKEITIEYLSFFGYDNQAKASAIAATPANGTVTVQGATISGEVKVGPGETLILEAGTVIEKPITIDKDATLKINGDITLKDVLTIKDGGGVTFADNVKVETTENGKLVIDPAAEIVGSIPASEDIVAEYNVTVGEHGSVVYYVGEDSKNTTDVSNGDKVGLPTDKGSITFVFTPDTGYIAKASATPEGAYNISSDTYYGDKTLTFPGDNGELKSGTVKVEFTPRGTTPGGHYGGGGWVGSSANVRTDSTSHGTFTVSDRYAKPGQTVTVTPRPDSGYMVGDVVVRDRNGNLVPVTDNGDGTYSFVVPESRYLPVTVSVTFVPDNTVGGFIDVTTDDYFADAVQWAVEHGITAGTSANTFSPNAGCTRGMIVTFLWKAYGSPEPATTVNPFIDVPASEYYCKPVLWAVENGITAGTSANTFSPNDTCTRGQAMTFLYKAAKSPAAGTTNAFVDVPAGAYYAQPVAWAVNNGITAGTSATTFSPDATCTRGQIVTFLYKALG